MTKRPWKWPWPWNAWSAAFVGLCIGLALVIGATIK